MIGYTVFGLVPVQVLAVRADVAKAKHEVEAAEAKVEAAKREVEAAKREVEAAEAKVEAAEAKVEAAKREFRAATDAEEKEMLRKDWKTAQKGLDDALAFAKSQRDRLVQLQQSTDAGTLPQHCKHPPTCCRGGNRVYGPLASLLHTVSSSHTGVLPASLLRLVADPRCGGAHAALVLFVCALRRTNKLQCACVRVCVCVRCWLRFTRGCPCIAACTWHFFCFCANHHVLHLLMRAYGADCSLLHAWWHRRRHHRLQHWPRLLQQLQVRACVGYAACACLPDCPTGLCRRRCCLSRVRPSERVAVPHRRGTGGCA